jgi:nucleoside phosphorylase
MIALLLATPEEARPLLDLLKARQVLDRPFETHAFEAAGARPAGLVIVTGMGPARAAAAADYAIAARGVTHVINLGLCGALSPALSPGSLLRVTETFDGDAFANLTLAPVQESSAARQEPRPPVFIKKVNAGGEGEPPGEPLTIRGCPDRLLTDSASIWPALPSARLVSVRTPVFGGDRRDQLAGRADVVDMEGHAVAQTAPMRADARRCTAIWMPYRPPWPQRPLPDWNTWRRPAPVWRRAWRASSRSSTPSSACRCCWPARGWERADAGPARASCCSSSWPAPAPVPWAWP